MAEVREWRRRVFAKAKGKTIGEKLAWIDKHAKMLGKPYVDPLQRFKKASWVHAFRCLKCGGEAKTAVSPWADHFLSFVSLIFESIHNVPDSKVYCDQCSSVYRLQTPIWVRLFLGVAYVGSFVLFMDFLTQLHGLIRIFFVIIAFCGIAVVYDKIWTRSVKLKAIDAKE